MSKQQLGSRKQIKLRKYHVFRNRTNNKTVVNVINTYKHSTIINYDTRAVVTRNCLYYDSRVENYDCNGFRRIGHSLLNDVKIAVLVAPSPSEPIPAAI